MEMDPSGVLDELLALVARFRPDLVADRLQPRRPRSGESRQLQLDLHPLHREHSWIHQLVPLLDRDPAHDRVTNYPILNRFHDRIDHDIRYTLSPSLNYSTVTRSFDEPSHQFFRNFFFQKI